MPGAATANDDKLGGSGRQRCVLSQLQRLLDTLGAPWLLDTAPMSASNPPPSFSPLSLRLEPRDLKTTSCFAATSLGSGFWLSHGPYFVRKSLPVVLNSGSEAPRLPRTSPSVSPSQPGSLCRGVAAPPAPTGVCTGESAHRGRNRASQRVRQRGSPEDRVGGR